MSKISRFTGNLKAFASAATGLKRTIFGGSTQSDSLDDNINADYLAGWETVQTNGKPTRQDFNAMAFTVSQLISYLHQVGIPEYDSLQEYFIDGITQVAGVQYVSQVDNNIGNDPVTDDGTNWKPLLGFLANDGFSFGAFGATEDLMEERLNIARLVDGQEYLSSLHKKFMAGTATEAVFSGDSTTAGSGITDATNKVDAVFSSELKKRGIQGLVAYNSGHGGETSEDWSDMAGTDYLGADMAAYPNADLYVVRWGLNDQVVLGSTVAQYLTSIETGLTRLRAWKDVANLSIVLMAPNSAQYAGATPNPRDPQFFEEAIPGLKALARKYQCVWIDTWHAFLDSVNSTDWQDVPAHTHPQDVMNLWINSLMSDAIVPTSLSSKYGTSNLVNVPGTFGEKKLPTDAGSTYPYGVSMYRALDSDGWPYNGFVITMRGATDMIEQHNIMYNYAASNVASYMAKRFEGNGFWTRWAADNTGRAVTPALAGSTTPGANTYSVQECATSVSNGVTFINGQIVMTALDPAMAGNVELSIPSINMTAAAFASVGRQTINIGLWGNINLTAGYTEIEAVLFGGIISLFKCGSGVPYAALTVAELTATTAITFSGNFFTSQANP